MDQIEEKGNKFKRTNESATRANFEFNSFLICFKYLRVGCCDRRRHLIVAKIRRGVATLVAISITDNDYRGWGGGGGTMETQFNGKELEISHLAFS